MPPVLTAFVFKNQRPRKARELRFCNPSTLEAEDHFESEAIMKYIVIKQDHVVSEREKQNFGSYFSCHQNQFWHITTKPAMVLPRILNDLLI